MDGGAAIAEVYRRVRFSFSVFNAFAAKSTKDPRNFDINSSLKFQGRQLWRWAIFSGHFLSLLDAYSVHVSCSPEHRRAAPAAFGFPATSTLSKRQSTMEYQVAGEDIAPEEITEETGWRTAGARRAGAPRRDDALLDGDMELTRKTRVKLGVIKASRMPPLPREEIKIVIRPQGGLDILKIGAPTVTTAIFAAAGISTEESMEDTVCPNPRQNIVVVSTPRRTNADRYVRMLQLRIREMVYDVNAYETAPDNTAKGVIRGIPIEDGPQELDRKIVNSRNPTAYGATLKRCSLYRKKIDVCYKCGHLGHRMDVCPNPNNRVCRGCGLRNPDQGHQCNPKCDLCGGAHLTADRTCKARYKTPYLVRKRRWEKQAEQSLPTVEGFPSLEHRQGMVQFQVRIPSTIRLYQIGELCRRGWGHLARGIGLTSEVHELKKARAAPDVMPAKGSATTPMDETGTPAAKKRALQLSEGGSIAGQVRSEIKDMMVMMQENIENLQMAMASLVSKVASIECNVNSLIATSQQQQPQMVQQQQYNEAEFLRPMHGGQGPGSLNNHHGASQ
ncbi:hypothetical protein HPB52_009455 [Rhipicephalus sanguineus]|uniref:CCHC-type domain-containing protein n=1 Tax=Rhipicephalus sanguineus TaxID=34632 RepID=A0A9D4PZ09_RHISA|nr:hypothetical protein HPB52_009455 [Rhipicephalus sanguineus]